VVCPHEIYLAIHHDPEARLCGYRQTVALARVKEDLSSIRQYAQQQKALGSERFQEAIERQLARPGILGRRKKPLCGVVAKLELLT
ncbi:MAG: hypothetical protein ABI411_21440, partial [Tahibacter sp.]